jgi:hypothetical protein
MALCIGVDLDNTIVSYDALFHRLALEQGLVGGDVPPQKEAIRDAIRLGSNGNAVWTRLQALAYGPRMEEAVAFPGVLSFFKHCLLAGHRIRIVSHKTQTAPLDGGFVSLRGAAVGWLERHGFFSRPGLAREDVFFESTRREKVARIIALRCSHFIDDLPEVFAEPHFPRDTECFLFSPFPRATAPSGVKVVDSWNRLLEMFVEYGS